METFYVRAPTRVDFSGGTLDLWPLFCITEGAPTLNLAIQVYAGVTVRWQPAKTVDILIDHPETGVVRVPLTLSLDLLTQFPRAIRFPAYVLAKYIQHRLREIPRPFQATFRWEAEAPVGSGLGGSSSLAVALVRAASRLTADFSEQGWQWRLMAWVRDCESAYLHAPAGTQDYLAALFGGLNRFDSLYGRIERHGHDAAVVNALRQRLVVLFSGEQHHSGTSNWEVYQAAISRDKKILEGLRAIKHITTEMDAELRSPHLSWSRVGKAMSQEWDVRKEVFRVHTQKLDDMLAFLSRQGVLGAKVCGAAMGGSLIALTTPEKHADLIRTCQEKGLTVLNHQPALTGVEVSTR